MKTSTLIPFLALLLPMGLMALGFGMNTHSAYHHHSFGEAMLYGMALFALFGLILYFSLRPKKLNQGRPGD